MHEGLGEVAAHLPLAHVVLLGEVPGAADERGEHGVVVSRRGARPHDPAPGIQDCTPLAAGEHGVLAQRPGRKRQIR
ncbi:hypothetical protein ABZ333_21620 [Streptomyces olivaceus]